MKWSDENGQAQCRRPDGGLLANDERDGPGNPQGLVLTLSNTLGASFCVEALAETIVRYSKPEIVNTALNRLLTEHA